jgi:hypothetical protein
VFTLACARPPDPQSVGILGVDRCEALDSGPTALGGQRDPISLLFIVHLLYLLFQVSSIACAEGLGLEHIRVRLIHKVGASNHMQLLGADYPTGNEPWSPWSYQIVLII